MAPQEQLRDTTKKMAHKFSVKCEIKCSADKYFGLLKNNLMDLTKIHPENYKSVEILEGDGKSVGSVRLWKYVLGANPDDILYVKEKTKAIDEENRSIIFSVIEGDVMNHYNCFDIEIHVVPKGDGSLVEWTVDFENVHDEVPTPHHYMDLFAKICKGMDAHLSKE